MIKKTTLFTLPVLAITLATKKDDRFPNFQKSTPIHPNLKAPYINFDRGLTWEWKTELIERFQPEQMKQDHV